MSSIFGTADESFDAMEEVIVEFRVRCVVKLVSDRDVPLGCSRGVAAGEGCVNGSFDVASSGVEGAVNVAVGVVGLLGKPLVLTVAPEASDVVCAPVDVEDPVGELVGEPDEESVGNPDGELVGEPDEESEESDDELVGEPDEESEESDGELEGSARASPWPENTAAPTPTVITRPANLPMPPHRLSDKGCLAR